MKWVVFVLGFFLISCTSMTRMQTPSGKPEITIAGVPKEDISEIIMGAMLSDGYMLKSNTESVFVYGKDENNLVAGMFFGSQYNTIPEHRVTFNLVELNDKVRVIVNNQMVTNPGSAFEKASNLNGGKAGKSWQESLEYIAILCNKRIGIRVNEYGIIDLVLENSPAIEAGVMVGDKITKVNGIEYTNVEQIREACHSTMVLEIERSEDRMEIEVEPRIIKP